jgi:hypothetical protein
MVSGTLSLFSSKCFSPFLHSTRSLSVSWEYLALPDGPGGFAQNSSCSALLWNSLCCFKASHTGLSPSGMHLSKCFCSPLTCNVAVQQPRRRVATLPVWALPRSLATTGGIINLFSLPRGTKMFQFPRLASRTRQDDIPSECRVVPFGYPRIKDYLHLPAAFRSLSRPSSPP